MRSMMKGGVALTKHGLPASLPSFSDFFINSHRLLLVRWAQLFIIVMCASMLHPMGRLLVYRLYAIGFIISALGITCSASTAQVACKKVQFWFGAFSLLQFMVVCQMAYIGAAPAVHSYLDWATSLTTLVPQMLVLDLSSTKLALFLLMHAGAETAFYLSVVAHSLPVALIRGTCLYTVVAATFLSFRRQAYAAYLYFRSQSLPPKHAEAPLPSKQQEFVKVEHQRQEEAAPICPPPIRAYRSRMRRKRVIVTIDTPVVPSQVPEESIRDLLSEVGSCLDGHVTDVCVRSGCIVVSLNVWEPLRGVGGLSQQPLANLHRSMVDVARAWLTQLNQGSANSAAPRVSVKMSDPVCSITATDHYTHGLPDATALYPDPSPASGPSLPKCTLSLPSAALLMPPLEQTNQHHKLSQPRTIAEPEGSSPSMGDRSAETSEERALRQHEQGAAESMPAAPAHTARMELPFEVFICPLANLGDIEVLGWAGEEDSPEEDSEGCVRLLASAAGQFRPVHVLGHLKQGCRHAVQVSISLPTSMAITFAGCLTLELWGARMLMCCHTTLLLPHSCAPVCKELQKWGTSLLKEQQQQQQPQQQGYPTLDNSSHLENGHLPLPGTDTGVLDVEGFHAFVSDLGDWLQFIGLWQSRGAAAAGRDGQQGSVVWGSFMRVGEEGLTTMAAVGKDLLFFSVRLGMASLAGILLKCLMTPPFSLPFASLVINIPETTPELAPLTHASSLLTTDSNSIGSTDGFTDEITNLGPPRPENRGAESNTRSTSRHGSLVPRARSSGGVYSDVGMCKMMVVEAALSGNTAMLEQVLVWGRALGGEGFTWPWEASDCSAYVLMEVLGADPSKQEMVKMLLHDPIEGARPTKAQGPRAAKLASAAMRAAAATSGAAAEVALVAAAATATTAAAIAGEAAATLSTTGAAAVGAVASRITTAAAAAAATSAGAKAAATAVAEAGKAAVTFSATGAAAVGAVASRTSIAASPATTSAQAKASQAGAVIAAVVSSAVREGGKRVQQEWRQAQQANRITLSGAQAEGFPSFSLWLLAKYKTLTTRWALLFFVVTLFHVAHPNATPITERQYLNFNMMMLPASVGMALASQRDAYSMVKLSMCAFWFLQVLTTVQMTMAGAAPAVHTFLDLATSLATAVPYMCSSSSRCLVLLYVSSWPSPRAQPFPST